MSSYFLPLFGLLLFCLIVLSIPVVLIFLVLLASQRNWNAVPKKEKVVSFVGFWKRISIGIVDGALSLFIIPMFFNAYFYLRDGQTIGDKIYGTKIVDTKTMKMASVGKLVMRHVAKILSVLCFGFGFFAAGVRTEKRAWHDEWAEVRCISYKKLSWVWTFLPIFLAIMTPLVFPYFA